MQQRPFSCTCTVAVYFLDATNIRVVYNKSIIWWFVLYFHSPAAHENTATHSCNTDPAISDHFISILRWHFREWSSSDEHLCMLKFAWLPADYIMSYHTSLRQWAIDTPLTHAEDKLLLNVTAHMLSPHTQCSFKPHTGCGLREVVCKSGFSVFTREAVCF